MIRYLLRDALRRHMPIYLSFGGFLALIWLMMVSGALAPTGALALSLGHAWFLGVFAGVSLFASREVGLLPIPRRTLWRAQWIASTLVATFWTTAAKLVAALVAAPFSHAPDLQFIVLSGCLDFLYNGVLLAVAIATGVADGRIRGNGSIIRKAVQASGVFVALMGGFAWGFVLRIIVPTSWAEVTGATAMVMGAALVVSLAAFFSAPPTGETRAGRVRQDIRPRQDSVRARGRGWLVGMPRLIADDLKTTAVMAAALPVIIGAAFYGIILFNPSPGDASPLKVMKEMGWLPLRPDTLFRHCFFLVVLGLSLVNNRMSRGADPSPLLRQLRVLPIGLRQLNALLVCRRLLGWVVVWLCLLAFHVVVFRAAPSTLRLDILGWVAGADALVYAVQLCWMNWLPTFAFAMFFGIFSASVIDAQGAAIAPFAGIAIGLACLTAAVWINHTTLTGRQGLYRGMAPPPFAKPFAMR